MLDMFNLCKFAVLEASSSSTGAFNLTPWGNYLISRLYRPPSWLILSTLKLSNSLSAMEEHSRFYTSMSVMRLEHSPSLSSKRLFMASRDHLNVWPRSMISTSLSFRTWALRHFLLSSSYSDIVISPWSKSVSLTARSKTPLSLQL